jgi:hypothetical protein
MNFLNGNMHWPAVFRCELNHIQGRTSRLGQKSCRVQDDIGPDLLMPQSDEIFAKGTPKGTVKLPFFLARGLGISTNSELAAQGEFYKCICVRNFTVVLIRHSETVATSLNTLKTFAKLAVSSCCAVHNHFCPASGP